MKFSCGSNAGDTSNAMNSCADANLPNLVQGLARARVRSELNLK